MAVVRNSGDRWVDASARDPHVADGFGAETCPIRDTQTCRQTSLDWRIQDRTENQHKYVLSRHGTGLPSDSGKSFEIAPVTGTAASSAHRIQRCGWGSDEQMFHVKHCSELPYRIRVDSRNNGCRNCAPGT